MSDRRLLAALVVGALLAWSPPGVAQPDPGAAPEGAEAVDAAPGVGGAEEAEGGPEEAAPEAAAPPAAPAENLPPELAELAEEVDLFEQEIQELRGDVTRLVEHQYERKRREVQARYAHVVDQLLGEERQRREDAIGRFEEFVRRYPDNPKYTPDALFRLAELHFEKANDTYVTALEDYDDLVAEFDAGRLEEPPPEPRQDYRLSIELFDRLIRTWPEYRNIDGAYYLKGYCLLEMGEDEPALDAFVTLVTKHPESRFVPETWTRIGEYYFDHNKLPEAIAAYSRVLAFPDSAYYDKALYKLAWTYYRNDQYVEAIDHFRKLIEFSDARAARTGGPGSELRAEAIQYLAISLQEDDWNGDGEPDPDSGFARVLRFVKGDKPYDVEILRALADIFFDNAKYEEAIASIRHLLQQFPNNEENPQLHSRMITAYERLQRFDDAFAERDTLARSYGEGSGWYAANEHKPKVIEAAEELMEDALIQAATYHHSRAQQLKDKAAGGDRAAEDEAIREYKLAAVAYENYLRRYPSSDNAYELNFFYAECLYYSFRFAEAAAQYASVRDSKQGDKYRELSGFSAILAHENRLRRLIQEGRLAPRPTFLDQPLQEVEATEVDEEANDGEIRVIAPEPIPEEVAGLLEARKVYVERELNSPDDRSRLPRIAYKLGEVYFQYKHFDEARKWFGWLVKKFPQEQVAGFAAGNIMETYRQANDWQKMAEWAEVMQQAGLGREFDKEIATLKVGALFKTAERLFEQQKYDEAAAEYIRLLEENPGNKYADAALNNAAVAYEKTRRFESATKMYERLYREHPDSQFAENALFRVGVNAARFYDFDKAIVSHLQLVDRYPQSDNRADSLYQAAVLLEQDQRYQDAARSFERYAELFQGRDDTAATYYRAAKVYEKLGDTKNQLRVLGEFVRRFGNDPKNNALVVESLAITAEIHGKQGRDRPARQTWQQVIDEFNRRGMQPGTFEARYPARAMFELVDRDFDQYASLKLRGSLDNQKRTIQEMKKRLQDLNRRYADVIPYKSFEWTLAAFYRLGQIYQLFAEALYDAPIPESFNEEEEDVYRTMLEDTALPIEDEAVKRFEQAYEKAREFRITNEWTKRILTSLNKYKPADYPLFKEERRVRVVQQLTPPGLRVPPPPAAPDEAPAEDGPPAAPGDAVPETTEAAPAAAPTAAAAGTEEK